MKGSLVFCAAAFQFCVLSAQTRDAVATVHVDATPGRAINSFDPDSALGSSIDVLSRTGIDKVYSAHIVQEALSFVTFGSEQYVWKDDGPNSHADPDGPPAATTVAGSAQATFTLPKASITVLRGRVE